MLQDYQRRIEPGLQAFFREKIKYTENIDHDTAHIVRSLSEFTLRKAKRLRAAFLYYGYALFAPPNDDVVHASLAMELVQSYLLIHDDIIDRDPMRRGKPTVHVQYAAGKDEHYGNSMAVLIGNVGNSYAVDILTEAASRFSDQQKIRAVREMNSYILTVILGQVRDLQQQRDWMKGGPISENDILKTIHMKSGVYTVEGPLYLGAILAGADDRELKQLSRYAKPLGIAFQLRDDINGLYGDEGKTGKPADSDVKQGKCTLLMYRALQAATPVEQAALRAALGNQGLTAQQLDEVRDIVKRRSLDSIVAFADEQAGRAVSAIRDAPFRAEGKEFLLGIAEFIARRDH